MFLYMYICTHSHACHSSLLDSCMNFNIFRCHARTRLAVGAASFANIYDTNVYYI